MIEMKITIDPGKSVYDNAAEYYDRSKKLRKKAEDTGKAVERTKKELRHASVVKETPAGGKEEKERWYHRFRWFLTSEGALAVGGKNADQNEYLFKRHFEKGDVFLHADIRGGSVVILKSSESGSRAGDRSLEEAAQFAASYSNAWKEGYASVDVTAAEMDQVSKSPPSGEYLSKGSFFLTGSMKHFKGVELKLLVGKTKEGEVESSPRNSGIERYAKAYELMPGNLQKEEAAGKIARELKVRKERLLPLVPAGLTSISRMK